MRNDRETDSIEDRLAFIMDLLGHDILNNNQAVLSYLELLLAAHDLGPEPKKYATKATSHIRTSTILMSDMKTLAAIRRAQPDSFKPADLVKTAVNSVRELSKYFPEKRVSVRVKSEVKNALTPGDNVAASIVLNLLIGVCRLDPSQEIEMSLNISEKIAEGAYYWDIKLCDPRARLPPVLVKGDIGDVYRRGTSRAVKLSEILFASAATEILGGALEVGEMKPSSKQPGVYLKMRLRRASKP